MCAGVSLIFVLRPLSSSGGGEGAEVLHLDKYTSVFALRTEWRPMRPESFIKNTKGEVCSQKDIDQVRETACTGIVGGVGNGSRSRGGGDPAVFLGYCPGSLRLHLANAFCTDTRSDCFSFRITFTSPSSPDSYRRMRISFVWTFALSSSDSKVDGSLQYLATSIRSVLLSDLPCPL